MKQVILIVMMCICTGACAGTGVWEYTLACPDVGLVVGQHAFMSPLHIRANEYQFFVNEILVYETTSHEEQVRILEERRLSDEYDWMDMVYYANNDACRFAGSIDSCTREDKWRHFKSRIDEYLLPGRFAGTSVEYDDVGCSVILKAPTKAGHIDVVFGMSDKNMPEPIVALSEFVKMQMHSAVQGGDAGGYVIIMSPSTYVKELGCDLSSIMSEAAVYADVAFSGMRLEGEPDTNLNCLSRRSMQIIGSVVEHNKGRTQ